MKTVNDLDRLNWDLAARQLIARFAQSVDARRMDECASFFANDATLVVGGKSYSGRAQIREWLRGLEGTTPGKHVVCNMIVNVNADGTVSAESDLMLFKPLGGKFECEMRGTYFDRFEVRDGQLSWRSRTLTIISPK